MLERLAETSPLDDLWQAALPGPAPELSVSLAVGLRVMVVRHLPGGTVAANEVLAANRLPPMPAPSTCVGTDPWQVWLGPTESLLLTTDDELADRVVEALRPGCHALTCALEQSAGWLVFDLQGVGVDELLPRLLDGSAVPWHPGQGVRARFMDIRAVVVRAGPSQVLIAVERWHGGSAAQWIGRACSAAQG
jgi:sarcosine oxidase gamma subunit